MYKIYQCLNGLAPAYLADDFVSVSSVASRPHLRSADSLIPESLSSGEQESYSAPETSPSPAQSSWILCQQTSELHRRLSQRLPSTWRRTCLVVRAPRCASTSEDYLFCAVQNVLVIISPHGIAMPKGLYFTVAFFLSFSIPFFLSFFLLFSTPLWGYWMDLNQTWTHIHLHDDSFHL